VFSDIFVQERERRRESQRGRISLSIAISKVQAIQIARREIARRELDDAGFGNMLKCHKNVISSPELQK
jgi:hypothetical protein